MNKIKQFLFYKNNEFSWWKSIQNTLNKITPYLVFSILIIYILNGYNIINISEMIYNKPVNTKLSGESKFIDFFYFIFSVTALCISCFYYLLIELKVLQNNAKINLLLRFFLVLELWYVFTVSNLYLINTFSILFWLFFFLLIFISVYIFILYRKEKKSSSEIITYTGKITFFIILFFYLSNFYLYFDKIKHQSGFTALYSATIYIPLLLSAAIFLRNSKNYFVYIMTLLVVPLLIIGLYQHS